MNPEILKLWHEYKSLNAITEGNFSVAEFGDSPELADLLVDLIGRGIKTATSSSYQSYLDENETLPEVETYFGVVTSKGDPVCICQVTDIRIGPLSSVDAAFAFDEGEGDRSLETWFREHRRFFGLSLTAPFDEEDSFMVVFERFRLVWPQTPNVSRAR